jgi:predicted RNA-binding Zn-ribbon protein involved in translation (DUF1610 family)
MSARYVTVIMVLIILLISAVIFDLAINNGDANFCDYFQGRGNGNYEDNVKITINNDKKIIGTVSIDISIKITNRDHNDDIDTVRVTVPAEWEIMKYPSPDGWVGNRIDNRTIKYYAERDEYPNNITDDYCYFDGEDDALDYLESIEFMISVKPTPGISKWSVKVADLRTETGEAEYTYTTYLLALDTRDTYAYAIISGGAYTLRVYDSKALPLSANANEWLIYNPTGGETYRVSRVNISEELSEKYTLVIEYGQSRADRTGVDQATKVTVIVTDGEIPYINGFNEFTINWESVKIDKIDAVKVVVDLYGDGTAVSPPIYFHWKIDGTAIPTSVDEFPVVSEVKAVEEPRGILGFGYIAGIDVAYIIGIIMLIIVLAISIVVGGKRVEEARVEEEEVIEEYECPKCGAIVKPDMVKCPECNELFEEEKYECPTCGATVAPDATFCHECGEEFEEED